ncbi:succinyldiaminopimelate transaminase [Fimbriimonas ginsengisoli]|uniref:Succinyldiaminopimelate aminotransferase n=1 Tax=Fimbriimonas ginsengisoli Gsoil 348 TaxID=661478 RepID=A0A068NYA3_FIMGI|nr:succinyldiaminopimelate transaminase [Fimbriimonas ginsengisoli]AIE86789.1 succinyldiaminopimelate aminotransferase [Fimbriimonas ginsengisoli Gsoil 348]
MNPLLDLLHPYPFERLRVLLEGARPPEGLRPLNLGIGEPQHPTPPVIADSLVQNLHLLGKYPPTAGTVELRSAISEWIGRRYAIPCPDPIDQVIPVAGTREALFALAQAVLDPAERAAVLLPNPFYQIYEGAALLAGAEPVYVPTPKEQGYLPDWGAVSAEIWPRVKLAFVCSPGNPTGAVMTLEDWKRVFELADRYGFVVAADECYSEIYNGDPPCGSLQASIALGRGLERVVSLNSLSKRSSAPGLRSGFAAGDADIIKPFLLYRTYHGAAPSSLTQVASVEAWQDETHVVENREKYREKFRIAAELFGPGLQIPSGGFFLWLPVPNDEQQARRLFEQAWVTTLPGTYLGREVNGKNPGQGYLRVALVPDLDVCREALIRIRETLETPTIG